MTTMNCIQQFVQSLMAGKHPTCVNVSNTSTTSTTNRILPPSKHKYQTQRPYVLLLQHSQSFVQRYDIPQQLSQRLQTGDLWLEYIVTTILHPQQQQKTQDDDPKRLYSDDNVQIPSTIQRASINVQMICIVNNPNSSHKFVWKRLQTIYGTECIHTIETTHIDFLNDNSPTNNRTIDLEHLDTIISAILDQIRIVASSPNSICVVMIDTMTPILIRHGYIKTIQFLQHLIYTISNINHNNICRLLLIPIRMEMITTKQHRTLEDGINVDAILNVAYTRNNVLYNHTGRNMKDDPSFRQWFNQTTTHNHGSSMDAMFIRRGIRERDQIRRHTIQYHFVTTTDSNTNLCRYQIEIETTESNTINANTSNTLLPEETLISKDGEAMKDTSMTPVHTVSSLQHKMEQLQMDEGTRRTTSNIATFGRADTMNANEQPKTSTITSSSSTTIQLPNIYMQDNDPEFDDYDEEDPDDDLDL